MPTLFNCNVYYHSKGGLLPRIHIDYHKQRALLRTNLLFILRKTQKLTPPNFLALFLTFLKANNNMTIKNLWKNCIPSVKEKPKVSFDLARNETIGIDINFGCMHWCQSHKRICPCAVSPLVHRPTQLTRFFLV